MTKPPEHGTTCQQCGTHVPAGTPQHQILGAGPTCEYCGKSAHESFADGSAQLWRATGDGGRRSTRRGKRSPRRAALSGQPTSVPGAAATTSSTAPTSPRT